MKMIILVGLKQFPKLGIYLLFAEPFHLDCKFIRIVIVVFGDDRGTSSSTVALVKIELVWLLTRC